MAPLADPLRARVLARYLGQLALVVAGLTCVPAAVAWRLGSPEATGRYAVVIGGLAALGVLGSRVAAPTRVRRHEAMALVALSFLLTPLVLSFPLMSAGLTFEDALFEAVSGITTTGLSTVSDLSGRPAGFLFARAWMQWVGGLGVVVLSIALVVRSSVLASRLGAAENVEDDLVGGMRAHARRVLATYVLLTAACAVALWLAGEAPFTAVASALAAVSTGGFAVHDASLAGLNGWPARVVVIVFCLAGSMSMVWYRRLLRDGPREALRDPQARALAGAVLLTAVAVSLASVPALGWGDGFAHGSLTAASAQSTAGFASVPPATLPAAARVIALVAMFVGGGVGSTAGGVKLMRVLVLIQMLRATLVRASISEHQVYEPRLAGRRIQPEDVRDATTVVGLFALVVVLSWLAFVVAGVDAWPAAFEVVSATATVGLSAGVTSPELPTALKLVLCADMWLGRLEVLPLLLLLYPRAWIRLGSRR
ncbi:MAG TPA: potassium transporter TrkG [Sandaracinaceae bacterium LLY-WYZ-13_1]|nr:potassium transporter TrkG [Sandaracinaceae bacterium LLY-WYZ-13_1]